MKNKYLKMKKQAGFTLQSILIGIVVLAILGAGTVATIQQNIAAAETENVKTYFNDGLANALSLCYLANGRELTNCNTRALLLPFGPNLPLNAVWGGAITYVATVNTLAVTYPIGGFGTTAEVDVLGPRLVTALEASSAPLTLTPWVAGATDLVVTYDY